MANEPGWIAGAGLAEINACASGHLQPVGRTAFFQEHLDVAVTVDQRLGSIGRTLPVATHQAVDRQAAGHVVRAGQPHPKRQVRRPFAAHRLDHVPVDVDPMPADADAGEGVEQIVAGEVRERRGRPAAGARLPAPMTALVESSSAPAQFAFDHGALGAAAGRFAFVVSGAAPWVERGTGALAAAVLDQARTALPAAKVPEVKVDFPAVLRRAGLSDDEQGRVDKTINLLHTLPAETPIEVRRQIVGASLSAFGIPVDQIIESAALHLRALDRHIKEGQKQTQTLLEQSNRRLAELEQEVARVKQVMQEQLGLQQGLTTACNMQKLRVQEVLEFFGRESLDRVAQTSVKLRDKLQEP